jgi:hypothetical protein
MMQIKRFGIGRADSLASAAHIFAAVTSDSRLLNREEESRESANFRAPLFSPDAKQIPERAVSAFLNRPGINADSLH